MKKLILLFLLLYTGVSFGTTTSDTVLNFNNPKSVIISENPDGVNVDIRDAYGNNIKIGCSGTGDRVVRSSKRFNRISTDCCGNWSLTSNGLYFGFVSTPGSPAAYSPDMGKSLEFGWLNILAFERKLPKNWRVSFGIGIDWRNYRSTRGLVYEMEDGHASASPIPMPGYKSSRIKIFSLQFPLLWHKRFRKTGGMYPGLSFGAIFNYNTGGSMKTTWRAEDGASCKFSTGHIGQREFTIDLFGSVKMGCIGIYARYSPYKILMNSSVLDYRPLSVGFMLFY